MSQPSLDAFLNRRVVLDTQGAIVYIGLLEAYDERGYWLAEADVHDRNEGHSSKERYVNDAHLLEREGIKNVNRRRVFVERSAIISVSALDDVIADRPDGPLQAWDE